MRGAGKDLVRNLQQTQPGAQFGGGKFFGKIGNREWERGARGEGRGARGVFFGEGEVPPEPLRWWILFRNHGWREVFLNHEIHERHEMKMFCDWIFVLEARMDADGEARGGGNEGSGMRNEGGRVCGSGGTWPSRSGGVPEIGREQGVVCDWVKRQGYPFMPA